jgi:hypothetical protein
MIRPDVTAGDDLRDVAESGCQMPHDAGQAGMAAQTVPRRPSAGRGLPWVSVPNCA